MSSTARPTAAKSPIAEPNSVKKVKRIKKRVVLKADGRYLIYYEKL